MMKITKISIPLFVTALFLAAGCTQRNGAETEKTAVEEVQAERGDYAGIAYVNTDSIVANYQMAVELTREFNIKAEKAQREFNTKTRALETKVRDYQSKIDKGLATRTEILTYQDKISAEEQELVNYGRQMEQNLQEEQMVLMNKVSDAIREYLKNYNADKKYSLILNNNAVTTAVLAADPALDITKEVLDGLNREYAKK